MPTASGDSARAAAMVRAEQPLPPVSSCGTMPAPSA
jgi:hypothetical protein